MQQFSTTRSQPLVIGNSTEAAVYSLFALAMGLTVGGVFLGMMFAKDLLASGMQIMFVIAELAIIFSSRLWMNRSPLNILLFVLFPVLSGLTVTPYLLMVLSGYENGSAILFNALVATTFMAFAAAVFARTTRFNLSVFARALLFAVLGLIGLSILQIFFVSLRTPAFELMISGLGIAVFAVFTAFDLQRIQEQGRMGANPFMLALSLYLDIFNLFLYVLRFMIALSGNRR